MVVTERLEAYGVWQESVNFSTLNKKRHIFEHMYQQH